MSTGWDMEPKYDYHTSPSYKAIVEHGKYPSEKTEEYIILNQADMLINSYGEEVDVMTRLDDIKDRYGEHSDQYLTACDICCSIGLTATNLASLTT